MPHRRLPRPQTPPRTRAAAARGPGPPPARACPHPPSRRRTPAPAGPAPGAAPVVACVARTPTTTTPPPTSAPGAATRAFAPRGLDQLPARGRRLPRQGRRHARQVRPLASIFGAVIELRLGLARVCLRLRDRWLCGGLLALVGRRRWSRVSVAGR